jgi:hypothetical protein
MILNALASSVLGAGLTAIYIGVPHKRKFKQILFTMGCNPSHHDRS